MHLIRIRKENIIKYQCDGSVTAIGTKVESARQLQIIIESVSFNSTNTFGKGINTSPSNYAPSSRQKQRYYFLTISYLKEHKCYWFFKISEFKKAH